MGDLYEQLHAISRWKKDLDDALKYYQKTVNEFKLGRLTDDALYRQGEIYFNRGQHASALDFFKTILSHNPQSQQSNLQLQIVSRQILINEKSISMFVK